MKRTALAEICVCIVASGCVYLDPLVPPLPSTSRAPQPSEFMPQLAAAVEEVSVRMEDVARKRGETIGLGRWLDIAIFGLGTTAAGAALTTHHVNTVRNSTFGAGVSFAASSLFAPRDVAMVYDAGVNALHCVKGKGAALRSNALAAEAKLHKDRMLPNALVLHCDPKAMAAKLDSARTAKSRVELAVSYIQASDPDVARRTREAADNVILEVNKQVLARANSPEAILAAAKALTPQPTGASLSTTSSGAPGKAVSGQSACAPEVEKQLVDFANGYTALETTLTAAANGLTALDTACTVSAPAIAALGLSQASVTVTKDQTFNILIQGGRPPYRVQASGGGSKDVDVRLVESRTIVVTGKSTITTASTTAYQVSDNSVISTPVTLTVTTQAPAATAAENGGRTPGTTGGGG